MLFYQECDNIIIQNWRKVKKEKIPSIYDEYRKPSFFWEIQASKLDESSAAKLP